MLQYEFEESAGYWVCMTSHLYQRALNEELAAHGITYRQWQVLAWLALEGNLTQAELAERMDIEPATLVSVLGRMSRHGWIERHDCPTDRRKKLIAPTRAAESVWERGCECARRIRARATRGLTQAQLKLLQQGLATMRENLLAETLATNSKG